MQVVGEEGGKGRGGGEASETRQGQQDTDAVWRRKIKTAGHPMTLADTLDPSCSNHNFTTQGHQYHHFDRSWYSQPPTVLAPCFSAFPCMFLHCC